MELGGVLLYAGMVLIFEHGDYRCGSGRVRFTLDRIAGLRTDRAQDWVVLEGQEKTPIGTWRPRRIEALVSCLKTACTASELRPVEKPAQDGRVRLRL